MINSLPTKALCVGAAVSGCHMNEWWRRAVTSEQAPDEWLSRHGVNGETTACQRTGATVVMENDMFDCGDRVLAIRRVERSSG